MLKAATESHTNPVTHSIISIGANKTLRLSDAAKLAHQACQIVISEDAYDKMENSYQFLKKQIDNRLPVYGINTNFGDQVNFLDPNLNSDEMSYHNAINMRQENIIKSLACGVGSEIPSEIIRVTMMLRAHCLAQGCSGVDYRVVDALIAYLNAGIVPIVPCYGSIGASGDLIPLGTIAAGLLGANTVVLYQGERLPASAALERAGLKKLSPKLRDGLALINGTSFMTAIAAIALYDLNRLFNQMLAAMAVALESMQIHQSAYHFFVHEVKLQAGQIHVAKFFNQFWQNSHLLKNNKMESLSPNERIQDYYSLRAIAQGFGPFSENLDRAVKWVENEMNSINDNPIINANSKEILHSANFMGYYITDACDILKMNIAQASTWIHAILANMVHPRKNKNLPTNIVPNPDINNGFRSMQLLAAALAVQNRKFAQAQQAFMLPTEGDNQDVNSLGTHAALDFREAVANLERLTAILLLAAAQALDLRGIENASIQAKKIHHLIRQHSDRLITCRPMAEEINTIVSLLQNEKL